MIAVIGHSGTVGAQVYRWFEQQGQDVVGYSLDAPDWDWKGAEYVFVCVPTPMGPEIVRDVISKIEGKPVVVIKSTVPPGTTEALQREYPHLTLLFNPEFLSASTAWGDFIRPERQIVGSIGGRATSEACAVMDILPAAPEEIYCTTTEAEILKYIHNWFGAMQVIFANHVYDICEAAGADFVSVRDAAASEWLPRETIERYWNVWEGGYRGYGGACFPKDLRTLLNWCVNCHVSAELLQATISANWRILDQQGLSEYDVTRQEASHADRG